MSSYKLTFGIPEPNVINSLPLSNWTIVNANTLSINGDTVTQLGIDGCYESMFVSFTVPESGSYKISYDYNITTAKVGNHGTYGFGLWLTTNNPNVSGVDQANFYFNESNRIGSLIGVQNEDISGKHGTISFNANLNAGTTYYLWYPGVALDDGTTYTLTFTNIRIYNNPIKYNYDNLLVFNGWNGYISCDSVYYIDLYYPVGTYYCSMSEIFDPNGVFVGTWIRDTDGLVTVAAEMAGITGGEETHIITTDELPSHTHNTNRVMFGDYNQDDMTTTWNHFYSTGNLDYVYNGNATIKFTGGNQAHNNIQKSIIGIRWHRID